MRRSLVLTDDSARHPFLRSLPVHVRAGTPVLRKRVISLDDVRDFLMAYCACFLAAMLFFA